MSIQINQQHFTLIDPDGSIVEFMYVITQTAAEGPEYLQERLLGTIKPVGDEGSFIIEWEDNPAWGRSPTTLDEDMDKATLEAMQAHFFGGKIGGQ